ncbi:hypothetical protein VTN49DRAFT_1797 [Thermomyces lanuginosus]|uniref:uncharacterized protein n=1 Tax=Thermomyces lanuginosus TaxID=5541 RepID=UPI003743F7E0
MAKCRVTTLSAWSPLVDLAGANGANRSERSIMISPECEPKTAKFTVLSPPRKARLLTFRVSKHEYSYSYENVQNHIGQ